jgi:hypothetical protein
MMLNIRPWWIMAATIVAVPVGAEPTGPRGFCAVYADDPACRGSVVACTQCHTAPPDTNAYGAAVWGALSGIDPAFVYDRDLPAALAAVEGDDSDGDGVTNLEEIVLGTRPGDAQSVFVAPAAPVGDDNPEYDVGNYDPMFALRRLSLAFCGRSPSFAEKQAFMVAPDSTAALHDALDVCLSSRYWLEEALPRLADKRIRPLFAIGLEGIIPLADYEWDYRLFTYVLSGDRDARDLLLADYHIDTNGNVVTGPIAGGDNEVGGQPVDAAQRAGMITTQWFLMIHTMFSELPRTTAAQAYRAYLGLDIARSEGLLPTPGEPIDIDNKGVDDQATCIYCHATLDPLSYAFAHYNGIGGGGGNGAFRPNRPSWSANEVTARLFDIELTDTETRGVRGWAEVAADSDAFRRNLVTMFMTTALGRPPAADEQDEAAALEDSLVLDGFVAEALLHRLIDTRAFGVP